MVLVWSGVNFHCWYLYWLWRQRWWRGFPLWGGWLWFLSVLCSCWSKPVQCTLEPKVTLDAFLHLRHVSSRSSVIMPWFLKMTIKIVHFWLYIFYHSLRHFGIQAKHLPGHRQMMKQPTVIRRTLAPQLIAFTSLILPLTGSKINLSTISVDKLFSDS